MARRNYSDEYKRAVLLVLPIGRATLDVGDNTMVREKFEAIERTLAA